MPTPSPSEVDVFILCGGKGTRLREAVADRPKPLATVGDGPFLDLLLRWVFRQGFRRAVLGAGHRGEMIRDYYRDRPVPGLEIVLSLESRPLGTGGAVKLAEPLFRGTPILVLNGDSYCGADLARFLSFHLARRSRVSLVAARVTSREEYGTLRIGPEGLLEGFAEKIPGGGGAYVNAGIYLLEREAVREMPGDRPFSLERDYFPGWAGRSCYAFTTDAELWDIGTPERYQRARQHLGRQEG